MPNDLPSGVAYVATSLDGYIARANGGLDWLPTPPDGEDYGWSAFLQGIDAIVMGRSTFETVLSFGRWPYGEIPVLVLSSTRKEVPEVVASRVELLDLGPRDVLRYLAERGAGRVYVDGGRTIQAFLREKLLDELVITTVPIVLGGGIPLFGPMDDALRLTHASTEVLPGGLVKSTYRRA